MRITKDTNVDSMITDINSLISGLNSIESVYKNSITTLNNDTGKIVFKGVWSDPVQERVEEYVGTLKSDTSTIETDITSGNYQSLKKKLGELSTELDNLKSSKNNLKERTSELNAENAKEEKDTARIRELESLIKSANYLIDNSVSRINTLLVDIKSIEFNKVYEEQELPIIAIEPVEPEDSSDQDEQEEEEVPQEESNSYNRTYTEGNMTVTYGTDENGRPTCTVVERNSRGDIISTVVYSTDERGYTYVNGEKFQGASSSFWDYQFMYVTVTDSNNNKTTIPILTYSNMPDGKLFQSDMEYLKQYGIDPEDYHYAYNLALGRETETSSGGTMIVDTSPN